MTSNYRIETFGTIGEAYDWTMGNGETVHMVPSALVWRRSEDGRLICSPRTTIEKAHQLAQRHARIETVEIEMAPASSLS